MSTGAGSDEASPVGEHGCEDPVSDLRKVPKREDALRAASLVPKARMFSFALDWEIVESLPDLPPKNQRQVQGGRCSK